MITNDDDLYGDLKQNLFQVKTCLEDDNKDQFFWTNHSSKGNKKSKTPVLDNFGRDLTAMAEAREIRPCSWTRKRNSTRVSNIKSRKKNNPFLLESQVLVNLLLQKV